MLSPKMLDAMNEQIRREFESAYIYLGMAAYFDAKNLPGFAHWMKIQFEEELAHTFKIYDFVNDRDEAVELGSVEKPSSTYDSPLDAFQAALKHEQYISKSIHDLYDLADEENDHASKQFLHWFIEEQVEEEQNAGEIAETLEMVDNHPQAVLMLDREFAQRQPPAEVDGEEE